MCCRSCLVPSREQRHLDGWPLCVCDETKTSRTSSSLTNKDSNFQESCKIKRWGQFITFVLELKSDMVCTGFDQPQDSILLQWQSLLITIKTIKRQHKQFHHLQHEKQHLTLSVISLHTVTNHLSNSVYSFLAELSKIWIFQDFVHWLILHNFKQCIIIWYENKMFSDEVFICPFC